MKILILENTWSTYIPCGYGNGYVIIPKGHKLHGMHYDDIHDNYHIDVHGRLTYSEFVSENIIEKSNEVLNEDDLNSWIVGFDTVHYGDDKNNWTKEAVEEETEKLKKQLIYRLKLFKL